MIEEGIIVVAATAAGAALSKLLDYLKARRQMSSDVVITEVEKAAVIYRELLRELQDKVGELEGKLDGLEHEHLLCRVENARLAAKVETLESRLAAVRPAV